MKKYLMTGVAALAFAATFTSCSKSGDLYDESKVNEQKEKNITESYAAAFEKAFGKVGANVDWGFSSKSTTRSAETNSNQWGTNENNGKYKDVLKKDEIPAIGDQELDDVLKVFNQVGAESYTSLIEWDTFFVQQVWKGTASHPTNAPNQSVIGGNQMDWLCAYDPVGHTETVWVRDEPESTTNYNGHNETITNHDDHVNNFNNANGSVMLMMNSSTSRFGYKSSSDNGHVFYYFRMEKINGMYYVGFDFSAEGQNPSEQVQRDYIYNDWIVKIVPGQGYTFYPRIIAEDLTASQSGDFDFNDVVFDVISNNGTETTFVLQACGGTLPLRIGDKDGAKYVEVHALFNQPQPNANGKYDMFNTGAGKTHAPVEFTLPGVYNTPEKLNNVKIEVQKNNTWMELTATRGVAACKILVDDRFPIVPERHSIADEQKNFKPYVQGNWNENDGFWWIQK